MPCLICFCVVTRGNDYKNHLKCISEDQKYGGKNYEAKANKGDVKQQQWIQVKRSKATPADFFATCSWSVFRTYFTHHSTRSGNNMYLVFFRVFSPQFPILLSRTSLLEQFTESYQTLHCINSFMKQIICF